MVSFVTFFSAFRHLQFILAQCHLLPSTVTSPLHGGYLSPGPYPRWVRLISDFQERDKALPILGVRERVLWSCHLFCYVGTVLGLTAHHLSCACVPVTLKDATQVPNIKYSCGHGFGQKHNGFHVSLYLPLPLSHTLSLIFVCVCDLLCFRIDLTIPSEVLLTHCD